MTRWGGMVAASCVLALAACKRPPSPAEPDGAAPPPASAGTHRVVDAGAPAPAEASAGGALAVVAIGASPASRILAVQALGDRVWLSGRNLDAYAFGDGPLVKGGDLLAKLPYERGKHAMRVLGHWPRLYALRWRIVESPAEAQEPAAFVYRAADGDAGAQAGTWTEAKPLGEVFRMPVSAVPFRGGALLVWSTIAQVGFPAVADGEDGTRFVLVSADGSVSRPKLAVPRAFMAWGADADVETVTLLGTLQVTTRPDGGAGHSSETFPSGVHVVHVGPSGTKSTKVQSTTESTRWQMIDTSEVVWQGGDAVVSPPFSSGEGERWKPSPLAATIVRWSGAIEHRTASGQDSCSLRRARLLGDAVYALRQCAHEGGLTVIDLVRIDADGKTTRIALPRVAKKEGGFREATPDDTKDVHACMPVDFFVRKPDDLWVVARCGAKTPYPSDPGIPLLLRRGPKKQEPLVIP